MQLDPVVATDPARLAEICQRYKVGQLSVFGSVARGQATPDSDIDILVEFLPEARTGLIEYAGLMLALSDLLGRKVDLVSRPALRPALREEILGEARPLYVA